MIWIIASIPFWIVAVHLTLVGVYGLFLCGGRDYAPDEIPSAVVAAFIALAIAGLAAVMAAKICS